MVIKIDKYRLELALKSIKNEPLDMDDELDFWLYHFNIKYNQVCEKYNLPNTGYNFLIYLKIIYISKYRFDLLDFIIENQTKSKSYNFLLEFIDKYQLSGFYKKLDKFGDIISSFIISNRNINHLLLCQIKINMTEEILSCYNLQIKFISRPSSYVSVRL